MGPLSGWPTICGPRLGSWPTPTQPKPIAVPETLAAVPDAAPPGPDIRFGTIATCGGVGGLLSGLLGIGGGTVMVPLMVLLARMDQRQAHAISLGAMIP